MAAIATHRWLEIFRASEDRVRAPWIDEGIGRFPLSQLFSVSTKRSDRRRKKKTEGSRGTCSGFPRCFFVFRPMVSGLGTYYSRLVSDESLCDPNDIFFFRILEVLKFSFS